MLSMRVVVIVAAACILGLPGQAHRPHDIVSSIAASPDGECVFAFIRLIMWRSVDGGASWSPAQAGMPVRADGTGMGAGDHHLNDPVPYQFAIHFSPTFGRDQDRTVFQTTEKGLLRSTNGGDSWALLPRIPKAAKADATRHKAAILPPRTGQTGANVVVLAEARRSRGTAIPQPTPLAHAAFSLWRSLDGGNTFHGVWPPQLAVGASGPPECTAIHAGAGGTNPGVIYAGCQSTAPGRHTTPTVLVSFDAGATWLHICDLPTGLVVTSIADVYIPQVRVGVEQENGGRELETLGLLVATNSSTADTASAFSVRFTYVPANSSVGVQLVGDVVSHAHVVRELNTDAGGAGAANVFGVASTAGMHPGDARVLYILPRLGSAVLQSRDAGASWQRLSRAPQIDKGSSINFNTLAVREGEAGIWKAINFTHIVGCAANPSVIFIGGYEGVHKSSDAGATWRKVDVISRMATSLSVAPASADGTTFVVAVCTYVGGCFSAIYDHGSSAAKDVRAPMAVEMLPLRYDLNNFATVTPRGALARNRTGQWHRVQSERGLPFFMEPAAAADYNVAVVSPAFADDGLIIVFSGAWLLWTKDRGTNWDVTAVPYLCVEGITQSYGHRRPNLAGRVTTVVFSPGYVHNNAVYVAGVNMGVSVTRDNGITHTLLFSKQCTAAPTGQMWTYYVAVPPTGHSKEDCRCKQTWTSPTIGGTCATEQEGCTRCDLAVAWCMIENPGCMQEEPGGGWAYCTKHQAATGVADPLLVRAAETQTMGNEPNHPKSLHVSLDSGETWNNLPRGTNLCTRHLHALLIAIL